jgi:hypothetical protein
MFKYIIYYLGLDIPDNITPLAENAFQVSLLCLIILTCFINVFGYLISMYLIKYYNVETKYSKYKRIIGYFLKSSWIWITIEGLIGFGTLIGLIVVGFLPLFKF